MSKTTFHRDYQRHRNHAEHRRHCWTGNLERLWIQLAAEARRAQPKVWCWYVLPGGAFVGMRRTIHGRTEFRILRNARLQDDTARERFEKEVAVFLDHFGLRELDGDTPAGPVSDWYRVKGPEIGADKTEIRFVELRHGEIRPDKAKCMDCEKEIPWEAGFGKGQRCSGCAAKAGKDYTNQMHADLGGDDA